MKSIETSDVFVKELLVSPRPLRGFPGTRSHVFVHEATVRYHEITIHGWRIYHIPGKPPWVIAPSGITMRGDLLDHIQALVLAAYDAHKIQSGPENP